MKRNVMKTKCWSFFLCMMLIVAMALGTTGCNEPTTQEQAEVTVQETQEEAAETAQEETTETVQEEAAATEEEAADVQVIGEGNTVFTLSVIDGDGAETLFEVHTEEATVGAALLELGMIAGDEGEFGLYVKTVNGLTVDYETDGKYWAFYTNDEYATAGVDSTDIEEGVVYSLRVE